MKLKYKQPTSTISIMLSLLPIWYLLTIKLIIIYFFTKIIDVYNEIDNIHISVIKPVELPTP